MNPGHNDPKNAAATGTGQEPVGPVVRLDKPIPVLPADAHILGTSDDAAVKVHVHAMLLHAHPRLNLLDPTKFIVPLALHTDPNSMFGFLLFRPHSVLPPLQDSIELERLMFFSDYWSDLSAVIEVILQALANHLAQQYWQGNFIVKKLTYTRCMLHSWLDLRKWQPSSKHVGFYVHSALNHTHDCRPAHLSAADFVVPNGSDALQHLKAMLQRDRKPDDVLGSFVVPMTRLDPSNEVFQIVGYMLLHGQSVDQQQALVPAIRIEVFGLSFFLGLNKERWEQQKAIHDALENLSNYLSSWHCTFTITNDTYYNLLSKGLLDWTVWTPSAHAGFHDHFDFPHHRAVAGHMG